ncbi:MAG: 2Fe-2S iron-sulfur cluster-binding protein [Verrucomicrobiales bacterium]
MPEPEIHIDFPGTAFAPVAVAPEAELGLVLSAANTPILFGCRSGICGTCLVEVDGGCANPPDRVEAESLDVYAPHHPNARLACQLRLKASASMRKVAPI